MPNPALLSAMPVIGLLALSALAVACLAAAEGELDPSFDGNGVVEWRAEAGNGMDETCLDVDVQGRPVLAGITIGSRRSQKNGLLVRFHHDGSRDSGFGDDGEVFIDEGGALEVNDVTHQDDGRILVLGTKDLGIGFDAVFIARYLTDGSPDTSFGDDGRRIFNLGSTKRNYGKALTVDADGRICLALGHYHSRRSFTAVARLDQDGSLDGSFGDGDGWMEVQRDGYRFQYPQDIIVDARDGIVVLTKFNVYEGTARSLEVFRLSDTGAVDSAFGDQGYCTWIAGDGRSCEMSSIAELADGGYLFGGHCSGGDLDANEIGLWRVTAAGALVDSFGADGYASIPYQPHAIAGNLTFADFLVQDEDHLLMVGDHDIDSGLAGSRFRAQSSWVGRVRLADGGIDSSFGENGFALLGALTTTNDIGAEDLTTDGDTRSLQDLGGLRPVGDGRHVYVGGYGFVDGESRGGVARVLVANDVERPRRQIAIDVDGVEGVGANIDEGAFQDVPTVFDSQPDRDHVIGFEQANRVNG